jgi:hypothetical protein
VVYRQEVLHQTSTQNLYELANGLQFLEISNLILILLVSFFEVARFDSGVQKGEGGGGFFVGN